MRAKRYASPGVEGDAKGIIRSVEQTTDRPAGTSPPRHSRFRGAHGVSLSTCGSRGCSSPRRVGLVLLVGIRHALDQPIYGPIDEAYHAGYVQHVADTGLPPMLGRDEIILAHRAIVEGVGRAAGPRAGTAPLPYGDHFQLSQDEAIQPPLYYYVVAPVAWFTRGSDKIYAAPHRELRPERARGAVPVPCAARRRSRASRSRPASRRSSSPSFTGITHLLSQVQNDALLLPVCVLLLWAFLHDLADETRERLARARGGRGRRDPADRRPARRRHAPHRRAVRVGGLPTRAQSRGLVWPVRRVRRAAVGLGAALNLHRYHALFPREVRRPPGARCTNTASELFSRTFQLLRTAGDLIVDSSYLPMLPAAAARRTAGRVC